MPKLFARVTQPRVFCFPPSVKHENQEKEKEENEEETFTEHCKQTGLTSNDGSTHHGVLEEIFIPLAFGVQNVRELFGTLLGPGASLQRRVHAGTHRSVHHGSCVECSRQLYSILNLFLRSTSQPRRRAAMLLEGKENDDTHKTHAKVVHGKVNSSV